MAEHDQDSKTEKPTDKRLAEASDRGQFAKSPEITVVFTLAATVAVLGFTARSSSEAVAEYSVKLFASYGHMPIAADTVTGLLGDLVSVTGRVLAPILLACVGAAMLAGGMQSGFRLAPEAIGFKPEALNPVTGFGRVFSKSVLVRSGIDLLKLVAIGFALYLGASNLLKDPLFTAPVEAGYLAQFLNQASTTFLTRLLLSLSIVAAISYAWEKFRSGQDLMMTREEVREERRNAEGDAHTKAAMKRMARRLMQKQMLQAVPSADVIVTNPTHYAVALKYERGRDQAPVILAKGENQFARRIKALAAEHGVPTVENKPVARVLYAMGKVGEAIPPGLYQAVAEILAVVYRTHRHYFHELKARRLAAAPQVA
jgi:flagellar biosynthetic protein FlhB